MGVKTPLQRVNGNAAGIQSKDWVQHEFDTPRAWTEDLVPRSSIENLNVTYLLIYEAKIHVSLDSVTNVTKFYDQPLMLEKYSFHISYYVD